MIRRRILVNGRLVLPPKKKPKMSDHLRHIVAWMRCHGGSCYIVRPKPRKGIQYLAEGQLAPALPWDMKRLVELGYARFVEADGVNIRIELTDKVLAI